MQYLQQTVQIQYIKQLTVQIQYLQKVHCKFIP